MAIAEVTNYKFNGLKEAKRLTDVLEQKYQGLEKYLHGTESITCDVEFQKVAPNKNGQVHQVVMNLQINGTLYRAEATEESFEKAIDEVRDEMDKELRRAKEKTVTLHRAAGRAAKEKMMSGV